MSAGEPNPVLLGRIVRPADYARVLAAPPRLRSVHFAVHHLEGRPLPLNRPGHPAPAPAPVPATAGASAEPASDADRPPDHTSLSTQLSTGVYTVVDTNVDDLCSAAKSDGRPQRWLGLVVPKRHARRAVTRALMKRQIRSLAAASVDGLPPGLWVVRLRAPFDPKQFPSAASDALKQAARAELLGLFERAVRGERDRVKPRAEGDAAPGSMRRKKVPASQNQNPGQGQGKACAR
jgi:ribonuclease P protein component